MKRLLALLLALLLVLPSGFALAEEPSAENDDISSFWGNVGAQLSDLWDSAREQAGNAAKSISEKAAEITAQAQEAMDDLSINAQNAAWNLAEEALQAWQNVQDAVDAGKEKAAGLIDLARESLPEVWEQIKNTAADSADAAKEFIQVRLQKLLAWIKDAEKVKADGDQPKTAPRALYFDVFYFGMPLSEARLLGIGPVLGNPVTDEADGVQYWTVSYSGSWDTVVLLFNGLDKNAPLTEIIFTVMDNKGAVKAAEEAAGSEETVNAVYNSISSWFVGKQQFNLGDDLLLPIYSGVMPADSEVSRARMFLLADGKGYDAATHFVLTGENGAVNMVQYQYVDAAKLEALLAE